MLKRLAHRQLIAIAALVFALGLGLSWDFPGSRGWHFDSASAKTDRTGTYDLAKARLLARVVGHIRAHYVSPERIDPKRMAIAALERVQADVPEVRFAVGPGPTLAPPGGPRDALPSGPNSPTPAPKEPSDVLWVTVGEVTREFGLDNVSDLYELNWKLMDIFEFLERHLPPQVDLESLEYAAVNGLLSTLDPHTILMSPRFYRELQLSQKGRFGGLGITVGDVEGFLVIQQVMRDTPASEAGLEADDKIVQIDAASTISMAQEDTVNLLRGEPGSVVTLWVLRRGWKQARPFKMVRREIQMPSVEETPLGDGLGWVHVRGFQETTDTDLTAALARLDLMPGGLKGLVLDLRDNPGGLLDKAIAVSDAFLSRGTIVTTVREGGRERDESHATEANTRANLPLVVLVNRGSASASEIVAGALKRNDRALIIGQTTFGKGSVQVVYKIDEAALKLTVAQYLTPSDVSIQGVGIVPDIDLMTLRVPAGAHGPGGGQTDTTGEPRLDLHPVPEDSGGEAALTAHLNSNKTRSEKSAFVLRLLEDLRVPTHRQKRGEPRIADAAVKLAMDVLKQAPAADRKQALVQLVGFFPKRQAEEDLRLESALMPHDVDWRQAPAPSAAAQKALVLEVKPPAQCEAGKSATLTVKLTNNGKRPVSRLHVELESSLSPFDGREVAFGWLEAGKSATRDVVVNVPAGASRAGDQLSARLYSDGELLANAPEATAQLSIVAVPSAVFAHAVQVVDREPALKPLPATLGASVRGNGDGLLQRGERVMLEVFLTNVGKGSAENVVATLRNESGPELFIHLGREKLGRIGPGESRKASFEIEILPGLQARLVEFELAISEEKSGAFSAGAGAASGFLVAPVSLELAVSPDATAARVSATGMAALPAVTTNLQAGASRDAPEIAACVASAVMPVIGRAGDWLEVAWGEGRTGWLPVERARLADSGGATKDAAVALTQHRPPQVEIETTATFTSDSDLPLKGVARFAGSGSTRRLIYIFRGRDKVFFRSADTGLAGASKGTSDGSGMPAPTAFEALVPLVPGRNDIVVIAREGDNNVARTTFSVYRTR